MSKPYTIRQMHFYWMCSPLIAGEVQEQSQIDGRDFTITSKDKPIS